MVHFNDQDGDMKFVPQDGLSWEGNLIPQSFEFPGAPMEVEWGLNVTVGISSSNRPAKIDIIGLGVVS